MITFDNSTEAAERLAAASARAERFENLAAELAEQNQHLKQTIKQTWGAGSAAPAHPVKTIVKTLPATGGRVTRKYDGEFCPRLIGGCLVVGELMRPKSGGFFTAADRALFAEAVARGGAPRFWVGFDVLAVGGESIAAEPLTHRWAVLNQLAPELAASELKSIRAELILGESPASVIARGGEGVCWQDWSAPYGSMLVIKAEDIFTCRVVSVGNSQSVGICDATTGQDRGAVKLGGGKCDRVRVGSLVRVAGMGLTDAGKIRQPTACREWLVTF